MPTRLSIRSMQYFLAAMDSGSLVTAASLMNVAPSAISNGIDQVEAEFSLKLVQKFPAKGLQPTTAGRTIARRIRRLIEDYDDLIAGGKELKDTLSGKLSIGYYAPVSPAFLPAITTSLLKQNPEIRLQFVECNNESAQQGLLEGRFDAILFVADNAKPGISCKPLIEAPPYLLTPVDHPLAKKKFVHFEELADIELVLLDLPFTAQYLQGLLDAHGIEPTIVATATTSEMVRCLVGAGAGCSILNMRPLIHQTYGDDPVTGIPIKSEAKPLILSLGFTSENNRKIVDAFAEACRNYFTTPKARELICKI